MGRGGRVFMPQIPGPLLREPTFVSRTKTRDMETVSNIMGDRHRNSHCKNYSFDRITS